LKQPVDIGNFRSLCGACKKCGTVKTYQQAYELVGEEWKGNALNAKGWCRKCVEEWIEKAKGAE